MDVALLIALTKASAAALFAGGRGKLLDIQAYVTTNEAEKVLANAHSRDIEVLTIKAPRHDHHSEISRSRRLRGSCEYETQDTDQQRSSNMPVTFSSTICMPRI